MRKNNQKIKLRKRTGRARRTRAKIYGTAERPRASVFRSLQNIYVQVINDEKSGTIVSASSAEIKNRAKMNKTDEAREVGKLIAERALKASVRQVVFDRRGYQYHGRVRALAESMREHGLSF
ncbi:MAG: 50S ribosomal protein L18 [Patescibacteria group bacterium]